MKLLLLLILSLFSCSNEQPQIGTGETIPNFAHGLLYKDNSRAFENKMVTVSKVILTKSGDSIKDQQQCQTDKFGKFSFENSGGNYVISSEDSSDVFLRVYNIPNSEDYNVGIMYSGKKTDISGRVVNNLGSVKVFVLGSNISTTTNERGEYFLPSVPSSVSEIMYTIGTGINFIKLSLSNVKDTTYLRDVAYYETPETDNSNETDYATDESQVFSVTPIFYGVGEEPEWYAGKGFGSVEYDKKITHYFVFNDADYVDKLFSLRKNWGGLKVPSAGDTAYIVKECNFDLDSSNAIVDIRDGGTLLFKDSVSFYYLHVDGGVLQTVANASLFGTIRIDSALFQVDNYLKVDSPLNGDSSAVFEKLGVADMQLNVSSWDYAGKVIITEGRIRARTYMSLGTGDIVVKIGGLLDMETGQALQYVSSLHFETDSLSNGKIELNTNVLVRNVSIGDSILPIGGYTRAELPTIITGPDTLFVTE